MKNTNANTEKLIRQYKRQLTRLEMQKMKPALKHYFIIMFVVVTLNFIIDIFGSNIRTITMTDSLFELANVTSRDVNDILYRTAYADFNLLFTIFGAACTLILPFYKVLTDKYGRKLFLWLNSLFIGVGMFAMMISNNIIVYTLGFCVVYFFFDGDVHQIYLLEESPSKWRATAVNLTKAIGILGSTLLGIFRRIFVTDETLLNGWRNVFLIPIILAVVTVVVSILLLRDTSMFINSRIEFLKKQLKELTGSDELAQSCEQCGNVKSIGEATKTTTTDNLATDIESQTTQIADEAPKEEIKGGVFHTLAYLFKHRQTTMIVITLSFYAAAMIFTEIYSTALSSGSLSADDISNVSIVFPIVEGLFALLGGLIADKFGRKPTFVLMAIVSLVGFIVWIVSIKIGLNGYLVGICYGLLVGGYWAGRTLLQTNILSESVPTINRASVIAVVGILSSVSFAVINFVLSQLVRVVENIIMLYFVCFVVFIALAIIFSIVFLHETKGVDLAKIRGDEWDKVKK